MVTGRWRVNQRRHRVEGDANATLGNNPAASPKYVSMMPVKP